MRHAKPTPRGRGRTALLGAALLSGLLAVGSASSGPATAAGPDSSRTVTAPADGPFAGLSVTLSQTQHLVNQAVELTWKGAVPTGGEANSLNTSFTINYLQVMQCWGDSPEGPDREQCVFGGRFGVDNRGGFNTASRNVSNGSTIIDPLETLRPPAGTDSPVRVPFRAVTGETVSGGQNEFYNSATTNEYPYALTRRDGTGQEFLEIQTAVESPGLGCGLVPTGASTPRGCWLVVVPRSDREVNGLPRDANGPGGLVSSPLSATNWAQRLVFPLSFEAIVDACREGVERPIVGQEVFVEAITRWQPTLCAGGQRSFSYTRLGDGLSRQKLTGDKPGLVVTTEPLASAEVPEDRRIVYAPVALSGVVVGAVIERAPRTDASAAVQLKSGTRVTDLKLTPRLVAKLLTQSYADALPNGDPGVAGNPSTINVDPDFLALNPEFADLTYVSLSDALVPAGQSDAAHLLWSYVLADADARAFLAGTPDPSGMVVNPVYQGLAAAPEDFPKANSYCEVIPGQTKLCPLDRRPYAADFHAAARNVSRGENLARIQYDNTTNPPGYKPVPPPLNGTRGLLAVTDAASAERYGLTPVRLRNAAGAFVAPTTASLQAGLAAMVPSEVAGVLQPDLASTRADAYPLTTVSYAAAAPAMMDAEAAADYADVLRYAAGAGQTPGVAAGTLPYGYAPLPEAMKQQTSNAAAQLEAEAGIPVTPEVVEDPVADEPTSDSGSESDSGSGSGSGSVTPQAVEDPAAAAAPSASAGPPATAVELQTRGRTEQAEPGALRWALLAALVAGAVAALVRPATALAGPVRRGVRQLTFRRPAP